MGVVRAVISRLKTAIVARFHLALENLALRQQLDVLQRSGRESVQSYVNATVYSGFCFR